MRRRVRHTPPAAMGLVAVGMLLAASVSPPASAGDPRDPAWVAECRAVLHATPYARQRYLERDFLRYDITMRTPTLPHERHRSASDLRATCAKVRYNNGILLSSRGRE